MVPDIVRALLGAGRKSAISQAYIYDQLGRSTQITQDFGAAAMPTVVMNQAYDALGRRTSVGAEIGGVDDFFNTYSYDALSRLTSLAQGDVTGGNAVADKRVDFAYDAGGQFDSITRYSDLAGNSLVAATDYTFDVLGRLADLMHSRNEDVLADYHWAYDYANRITQFDSADGSTSYSYDATGQLTGADHASQSDEAYSYDANGNRIYGDYVVGSNNRLLSDGTYNYTYDDEGNRLTQTRMSNTPADDHLIEYTWDHRNRLTKVTFKDNDGVVTKVVGQTYDLFNRWVGRSVDSDGAGAAAAEDTLFVYDSNQIVLQLDGSTPTVTHRYLWGLTVDQIVADEAVTSPASAGDIRWTLADNQNSARDVIDSDGDILNHINYDSYGNVTAETDASVDTLFGYTGRPFDASTGLQNNLNRWYDSEVGRWISIDPIGFDAGDPNTQRYVFNNSVLFVDPTGLEGPWAGYPETNNDTYPWQNNPYHVKGQIGGNTWALRVNIGQDSVPYIFGLGEW